MTELSYWHWLALGIVIMIADSLGSAGFLIAIGSAAISLGLFCLVIKTSLFSQLLIFAVLCIAYALIWWRFFQQQQQKSIKTLNRPLESMLGHTTPLVEAIVHGQGKIQCNDAYWRVHGPDLPKGQLVRVIKVAEDTLIVEAAK